MSFRSVTLFFLLAVGGLVVIGACGGSEGEDADGDGLTGDLAVPPATEVVVVATATVMPTATPEPTATVAPEPVVEKARVNIPNRGYNSLGNPDAPITMFDFSDFL